MDWVTEKMQQARLERIQLQNQVAANGPVHKMGERTTSEANKLARTYNSSQKIIWVASGLILGVTIVIVAWLAGLIGLESGGGAKSHSGVSEQFQLSFKPQRKYNHRESAPEKADNEIVADTVSGLDMLPPPAAGKTDTLTATETVNSDTATAGGFQPASIAATLGGEIRPAESKRNSRLWAINLASLREKADAQRFLEEANAKGIFLEINQCTVNEKNYWRVQVTGFSSADEAKARASYVQAKLGLKDVWIVRQ